MAINILGKIKSVIPAYTIMSGLATLGAIISYLSTPWGVLLDSDSYFYLTAAKNFKSGLGLGRLTSDGSLIPLTHYPPLYSLLVGGFSLLTKGNVLISARIIACILFGLDAIFFGYLIAHYTRYPWAGVAGAIVFLTSSVILSVIVAGLSEGLFFAFLLPALFFIDKAVETDRLTWTVGAAVCTSLACLTRYVGVALIVACLIPLLINSKPMKWKVWRAFIFGAISGTPVALWYLRDWLLTGSATNRVVVLHWPGQSAIDEAVATTASWLFPGQIKLDFAAIYLFLIVTVCINVFIIWWVKARNQQTGTPGANAVRFAWVLIGFILVYCLELLISRAYLDASTRWQTRIFSPLYLTGLLFLALTIWYGFQVKSLPMGKIITVAIGVYLVVLNIPQTINYLQVYYKDGLGYTDAEMQKSEALAMVETYADNGRIFSNNAAAIYFNTDRIADWIPQVYDPVKALVMPDYQQNINQMRQMLKKPNSLLILFKPYFTKNVYPPLDELTSGLVILDDFTDATIYISPAK